MADSMGKSEKTRKLVLGSSLIATIVFVVLVEDEAKIYPIQPVQSMQTNKNSSEAEFVNENNLEYLDIGQLGQRKFKSRAGELFNSRSWDAAKQRNSGEQKDSMLKKQAIQRAASLSAASKPPPLPFKYLGKIIHNNHTKIILSQSDEKVVASLGEHIDDQYRLDAMDSETVTLTYLPLNVEQTLIINSPGSKR